MPSIPYFDGSTELTAAHMREIIRRVRSCAMTAVPPLETIMVGDTRHLKLNDTQLAAALAASSKATIPANPADFIHGHILQWFFPPCGAHSDNGTPARMSFSWEQVEIIGGRARVVPGGIVGDGVDKNPAYSTQGIIPNDCTPTTVIPPLPFGVFQVQAIADAQAVPDPTPLTGPVEGTPFAPTVARFYTGASRGSVKEWFFDFCCTAVPYTRDTSRFAETTVSTQCQTPGPVFITKKMVLWQINAPYCSNQCGPLFYDPTSTANEQCPYIILYPTGDPRGKWMGQSGPPDCTHTVAGIQTCGPPCTDLPNPNCIWNFTLESCDSTSQFQFKLTETNTSTVAFANWKDGLVTVDGFILVFSMSIPTGSTLFGNCCDFSAGVVGEPWTIAMYVYPYDGNINYYL